MTEKVQLKKYIIEAKEELKFKVKPPSKTDKITMLILFCFFFIPLFAFSILSFVKAKYIYVMIFSIGSAITIFLAIFATISEKKKLLHFQFILNDNGITHSDVDATYFLPWEEVVAYGFVNFCALTYSRRRENESQMCVYFAKTLFNEKTLRKRINKMSLQKHEHCSSNELIVLALGEEDRNNLYYEIISKYINCSKEKEINYFMETCPW